ncbi:MAG: c-type cytochrome, partial [Albimonas sp.]|uniref:c-type cytochrome n=1 Tax=Albimonas sp. TaxID=1872425 RepID=UPI0040563DB0
DAGPEAPVAGLFARALHRGREASEARGDPSEGRAPFLDSGCGACHRVAGVVEAGEVGPDLTPFASRRSLAAGVAELSRPLLIDWLRDPAALKAGARMPAYGEALDEAELAALADWLLELR